MTGTPTTCCGRIIGADAARAVGRFDPAGPHGYRARSLPDGPLRATRAEAERDEHLHLSPSCAPFLAVSA